MKKIISGILSLALCVGAFTGCSKQAGNSDVTTVTVWTNDAGAKMIWEEVINDFNQNEGKEKKIQIKWETYASDYATTVDVARQNDQLPEILTLTANQRDEFIAAGDIISLYDIEGGKEFLEEYPTPLVERTNLIDGKVYSALSGSNVAGLIYNKDLFKKAGIVDENGEAMPPKTMEELREYAKKLTNVSEGIYGYSYPMGFDFGYTITLPASQSYVIQYDCDNLKVSYDEVKPILSTLLQMKEDGSLFPGAESLDNDTSRAYFAEGKVGMMPGISWDVGVLTTQFVADCDWGVAAFPLVGDEAKHAAWHDLSGSYFISKTAKNIEPEKLMAVYKLLYSKETRAKMYENGIKIPCIDDLEDVVDTEKIPEQFVQFKNLYDDEYVVKNRKSFVIEGDSLGTVWEKVWMGKTTLDEGIDDFNKRASEAFEKAVKEGKIDVEEYRN